MYGQEMTDRLQKADKSAAVSKAVSSNTISASSTAAAAVGTAGSSGPVEVTDVNLVLWIL